VLSCSTRKIASVLTAALTDREQEAAARERLFFQLEGGQQRVEGALELGQRAGGRAPLIDLTSVHGVQEAREHGGLLGVEAQDLERARARRSARLRVLAVFVEAPGGAAHALVELVRGRQALEEQRRVQDVVSTFAARANPGTAPGSVGSAAEAVHARDSERHDRQRFSRAAWGRVLRAAA